MIFEWDDFGANHVISDMCQSHDCRDQLDKLHAINPAFKCTLFAIPGEMTLELLRWCIANRSWIELAVHGLYHTSNYECEKLTYSQFENDMGFIEDSGILRFFTKGFRAPGWQISDDIYKWLLDNGWWVADQSYNNDRRPKGLSAYVNHNGHFDAYPAGRPGTDISAYHGHTWDVGQKGNAPNGIYEDFENVAKLVAETKDFKFISELFA